MNSPAPTPFQGSGTMPHCEAAVEWLTIDCAGLPVSAAVSRFHGTGGVTECHVTIQLEESTADPAEILDRAWRHVLASAGIDPAGTVFRRYFCSDVVNQETLIERAGANAPGAVSIVGQTPLPAAKLALWSQHLADSGRSAGGIREGASFACPRGNLTHRWITALTAPTGATSADQTRETLESHTRWLARHRMTLDQHVVRTWWFVRDIDADYHGLVDARREHFAAHGLTHDTHYIASTGIAGTLADQRSRVALDSYAVAGLAPGQIRHLRATSHLCPTHDYGVTFERATAITYSDRRHVFLSGTASIDSHGRILHEGDVISQLDRTLENIEALLAEAEANLGDLAQILVYLRDPADGPAIRRSLRERLEGVPFVLLHAPVCRPGWLIEIEGLAIVPAQRPDLPPL